ERMVPRDLGDKVVAEVVFGGRVLPIVGLQNADKISRRVVPKTGWFCLMREVIAQGLFAPIAARHRQITGQNVVERWHVGRTLDRCVPAQRQDTAARAADVAKKKLQD